MLPTLTCHQYSMNDSLNARSNLGIHQVMWLCGTLVMPDTIPNLILFSNHSTRQLLQNLLQPIDMLQRKVADTSEVHLSLTLRVAYSE